MKRLFVLGTAFALLPAMSDAAELDGRGRVALGAALDTNPLREFTAEGDEPTLPGAFAYAVGSASGVAGFRSARLLGSYEVGARAFLLEPHFAENTVIQAAEVEGAVALRPQIGVGLAGRAKHRGGATRRYTDLAAQALLDFVPDASVSVRVWAGAHRFLYRHAEAFERFSFSAPEAGATVRYRIDRSHALHFFAQAALRRYASPALARAENGGDGPLRELDHDRRDTSMAVGLGWTYRGPWQLSLSYAYSDDTSNSYAESWQRHRFSATAGVRLPAEITLLAQLSLQLVGYPDGILLSTDLLPEEDAENFNNASVKLVRPLSEDVDLEAKGSIFYSRLPNTVIARPGETPDQAVRGGMYLRQLFTFGFTWRI